MAQPVMLPSRALQCLDDEREGGYRGVGRGARSTTCIAKCNYLSNETMPPKGDTRVMPHKGEIRIMLPRGQYWVMPTIHVPAGPRFSYCHCRSVQHT